MKAKCCLNTAFRKIVRSVLETARRIAVTAQYVRSRHERKKVEMLFAHLKRILRLDRLEYREVDGQRIVRGGQAVLLERGSDRDRRGNAAGEQQLIRPREAEVAQQDRGADAEGLGGAEPLGIAMHAREAPVRRGQAATGVGAVHDVVVDESAGLEELQSRGCAQGFLGVRSAGAAVAPPAERRTQPLAAAEQVGDSLDERVEVVADAVEEA